MILKGFQKLFDNGEAFVDTKLKRVGAYQQQIEDLVMNPTVIKGMTTGINKVEAAAARRPPRRRGSPLGRLRRVMRTCFTPAQRASGLKIEQR